jgi:hypothetical protein
MAITIIKGPAKSGKSELANALRNSAITNQRGALLVDDDNDGETKPLIEKLLLGTELPEDPPKDLSKLEWKPDPIVVFVGKGESRLKEFEKALPGFTEFFGPIRTLTTDVVPAAKRK